MISSGAGGRRHSLSDMKNDAIAVAAAAAKSAARAAATSTNKEAEMTSAVMMDRAHATNSSFAKITLSNKPNQSLNCEERAVSNNNNNKKKAAKKKSSSVIDGMKSEEKSEEEVAAVKIFEGDNNRLGNSSEEAAEILFHKSLTAVCSKENRPQLPRPNITTSTSLNSGTKLPPAECLDNPNNELLLLKKSQRPSSVPPTKKLDETVKLKKKMFRVYFYISADPRAPLLLSVYFRTPSLYVILHMTATRPYPTKNPTIPPATCLRNR